MKAIKKLAVILGAVVIATSVAVIPSQAGSKTPSKPKKVSQEVSWQQAMQKPGVFEKTNRRKIQLLNRVEVIRVLPKNRKGQAMYDLRGTIYTSLGTDAFTVPYMSEIAMLEANQIWEEAPAKRGKIVWTPFGRAYKWTVDYRNYAMKKPWKDNAKFWIASGTDPYQWHRHAKTVDGKAVPAQSIWTIGPTLSTYKEALEHWPKLTKQMGS